MSPVLNGSSALERFECSNAIEICNGIMFGFHPGLPHITANKYLFDRVIHLVTLVTRDTIQGLFWYLRLIA